MLNWLKHFQLERISFFIGFLTASLFWWLFVKTKKWWPEITNSLKNMSENIRRNQSYGLVIALRKDVIKRSQSNHIGAKLFRLNEILVEPSFLIPPHLNIGAEKSLFQEEAANMVAFSPELTVISRNFSVPKIEIYNAIQKYPRIAISGIPGSGKTFTMAHLASLIAEKNVACGNCSGKTPFYFHVYDTSMLLSPNHDLPTHIYKAISPYLPSSQLPKLAKFIDHELTKGNAIIILDGLDELHESDADKILEMIERSTSTYPFTQWVLSTSPYYFGNLERMNFVVLPIAAMSNAEINELHQKWISLWYRHIFGEDSQTPYYLKRELLLNWANFTPPGYTSLENTLYIWGALSGDLRGNDTLSIYESLFSRIFQAGYSPDALAAFAYQFIEADSTALPAKKSEGSLSEPLLDWGILSHKNDLLVFNYIDLLTYLASMYPKLKHTPEKIELLVRNAIDFSYMGFLSARNAQPKWVENSLQIDQAPLYYNLTTIFPWLRHAPINTPWRTALFKTLIQLIQNPITPTGIKARLSSAFAYANDPSLNVFCKQLLSQSDNNYKILALLLIGSTSDNSLNNEIIASLSTSSSQIQKYSALALSVFEDDQSYHALALLLLNADEDVRKLVAESLANMKLQGIDILKDAITLEDISVRRSAIFGLAHINELWAYELLGKLSIEDSQWVVRNVAHQAVEYLDSQSQFSPQTVIPLYEKEWLIQFAADQNLGISPEINPTPLLLKAINSGTEQEKLNAMAELPLFIEGTPQADIIQLVYDSNQQISEMCANMIWRIYQSGTEILIDQASLI